jgi:hypothetical protein
MIPADALYIEISLLLGLNGRLGLGCALIRDLT